MLNCTLNVACCFSLVNSPLSMDKSVMEDIPIETKHNFVGGMRPALSRYKSALHNLQTEPNVYPHKVTAFLHTQICIITVIFGLVQLSGVWYVILK